jgi:hypothetical protein
MTRHLLIVILCFNSCFAALGLSKDTLLVNQVSQFSKSDTLWISNSGSSEVAFDTIMVEFLFGNMQGVDSLYSPDARWGIQIGWGNANVFQCNLDYLKVNVYGYIQPMFSSVQQPIFIPAGGSITIHDLYLGNCLICNRMPMYPKHFRTRITLYGASGRVSFIGQDFLKESITFSLALFSGRPNPIYTITDTTEVRKITRMLDAVFPTLDTLPRSSCNSIQGG